MERIEREIPKHCNSLDRIRALENENKRLEEENKKLNEKYNGLWKIYTEDVNERVEENKKLKEEIEVWKNANKKLRMHDAKMEYENEKLREELSAYDREYFDEDKKAKNIYKSQKENILMGKI